MKTQARLSGLVVVALTVYFLISGKKARIDLGVTTGPQDYAQECTDHSYRTRIFSLDPLVIHISGFVTPAETQHLLEQASGAFAPSQRVDAVTGKIGGVDVNFRKAETAFLESDHVTECIQKRAVAFQGHVAGARVERLQVVRYHVSDFVRNHFDWFSEDTVRKFDRFGRRDTSFFFYLHANCTGGGTNFPRLQRPQDPSWCDVIDCHEPEANGVTFKAVTGTGVFWQNWHTNNTPRYDVLHSGVPLTEGTKVGLNLWTSGPKTEFEGKVHDLPK